jgi:hypothetical protein
MVMWPEFFWLRDKVQWRAPLNTIVNIRYDEETEILDFERFGLLAAVGLKM